MYSTLLDARTVAIVRDLKVEQRNGANGTFESKSILFRIAVDRSYKVTRQENGKTISEYPTDFWLARATGNTAQLINDYCTAKKEDGKLVSRRLLLSGNFENYDSPKTVHGVLPVVINGVQYNVEGDVPVQYNKETIFVVNEMKFLDSQKKNEGTGATQATATPVGVATPVGNVAPQGVGVMQAGSATPAQPVQGVVAPQSAQPVQGVPVQPVQNASVAQAPVQQVQASAQPVQGGTVQSAPANGGVENAMNQPTIPEVPTVGPGFVPTSQNTPF